MMCPAIDLLTFVPTPPHQAPAMWKAAAGMSQHTQPNLSTPSQPTPHPSSMDSAAQTSHEARHQTQEPHVLSSEQLSWQNGVGGCGQAKAAPCANCAQRGPKQPPALYRWKSTTFLR